MTISEFREKRKNINRTHPAPEGFTDAQKVRFHSKIAFQWINELPPSDMLKASQEMRTSIAKQLS